MYQKMLKEMFEAVSQAIGVHVMLLVIEQALWKTKFEYQEAELIKFSEDGISLDGLDGIDKERADLVFHEFVMAIVSTLSRLVGIQLANQLTYHLKTSDREELT